MNIVYQVWKGDNLVTQDKDVVVARKIFNSLTSGKGLAPSKRRQLLKCEILEQD